MSDYAIESIDRLAAIHGGAVKLAGADLGVEGVRVLAMGCAPNGYEQPEDFRL